MKTLLVMALLVGTVCVGQQPKHIQPKPKVECKEGDVSQQLLRIMGEPEDDSVKVCRSGKWVVDEQATQKRRAENDEYIAKVKAEVAHKKALWVALRTRVVTDAEMKEILEAGPDLIPESEGGGTINWCGGAPSCGIPNNYKEIEMARTRDAEIIFNNALLNQFKMRTFAKEAKQ